MINSFKKFVVLKEEQQESTATLKDWRKEFVQLEKGFIPPPKMKPIVEAFLNSSNIKIMDDTTKSLTMPKKSLFLCGGSVRDFLKGKSPLDYHLATNATPAQVALILHSAGFRFDGDSLGRLKLSFTPKKIEENPTRTWRLGGKDKSGHVYSIIVSYKGEDFEISTLRKSPKVSDPASASDFVDSPHEDANTRDLTINALYIELSKSDGENNKLYDPTKKGWHDAQNGIVRPVGNAEERFQEDPHRIPRMLRFHSRFSKGSKLEPDVKRAMGNHKSLDSLNLSNLKEEFLKGLLHPDCDVARYVNTYKDTGLFELLFPKLEINTDIPPEFSNRKDKPLALAWLLQNNPIDTVADVLSSVRAVGDKEHETGWNPQDKNAVLFLLKLKEFEPDMRHKFLSSWKGTGLSKSQIKNFVDLFNFTDVNGVKRNRRPLWAVYVRTFADNDNSLVRPEDLENYPDFLRDRAQEDLEVNAFKKLLPNHK